MCPPQLSPTTTSQPHPRSRPAAPKIASLPTISVSRRIPPTSPPHRPFDSSAVAASPSPTIIGRNPGPLESSEPSIPDVPMSSLCISEGLRSDAVAIAAGPLAGLHNEMRNERRGVIGAGLRGADQVFESLSQRRKEVDTMFLGSVGDGTAVQAAAPPEIRANEEGNPALDALLSHLQSCIGLEGACCGFFARVAQPSKGKG